MVKWNLNQLDKVAGKVYKPLLVVVSGPTASGKTAVAIDLAKHFDTEILSADSRQCFKEMNIGVARPSPEELHAANHHFIASHSIHQTVDAAVFESYGLQTLKSIFSKRNIAIVAGGTGLYIRALCKGLDTMPEIGQDIRSKVRKCYEEEGLNSIQKQLFTLDPAYSDTGEMHNPHRVMRALEVFLATGKSIRYFQQNAVSDRPFRTLYIGMKIDKEQLHRQINIRVDNMMSAGLLKEVQSLQPYRHLNPLQTVGYKELFSFLDGDYSLETAIDLIKQHTRQYAKRQITWFKKTEGIHWIPPAFRENMYGLISRTL